MWWHFKRKEWETVQEQLDKSKTRTQQNKYRISSSTSGIWSSWWYHLGTNGLRKPYFSSSFVCGMCGLSWVTPLKAFFSEHPMFLAYPTSWSLHCNLGFTFTTSPIAHSGVACRESNPVVCYLALLTSGNLVQPFMIPSLLYLECL